MSTASLNISVVDKRLLSASEAANYVGLPAKHFLTLCPMQPVELKAGVTRYDKRDLDSWIDTTKGGADAATNDAILARL